MRSQRIPFLVAAVAVSLAYVGCGGDTVPDFPGLNGLTTAGTTGVDASTTGVDGGTTGGDAGTTGDTTTTTGDTTTTTGVDGGCMDTDLDGVCDDVDACEGSADSLDTDADTVPDGCDTCADGDDTLDTDTDETPDDCDDDDDDDGLNDEEDNCPLVANADQTNSDGDPDGDACDDDDDADGLNDAEDNCPLVANPLQTDDDADGRGNECDLCEGVDDFMAPDSDADTVPDACDICNMDSDNFQGPSEDDLLNTDGDEFPNGCDLDDDDDGVLDDAPDNCPLVENGNQLDTDADGEGDACDLDDDDDGVNDRADNCPLVKNGAGEAGDEGVGNQTNTDGAADGGDACDGDDDNDGVLDAADNCQFVANGAAQAALPGVGNQTNTDALDDGGDACDDDDDEDGVLDGADRCPDFDDSLDDDDDGTPDACDQCPGSDDDVDVDGDDVPDGCDDCGPGKVLASGASLWLRLGEDDTTQSVVNSVTGAARGTYGSAIQLGLAGPSEDFDGAAYFPGASNDSHVALRQVSGFPTDALSVTLWVEVERPAGGGALPPTQTLLSYAAPGQADALSVSLIDDGTIRVEIDGDVASFALDPVLRSWVHLAVTWDGVTGELSFYANGSLVDATGVAEGSSLTGGGNLLLGQGQSAFNASNPAIAAGTAFRGALDEVAVFGSVLDGAQIAAIVESFGAAPNGCATLPSNCLEMQDVALDDGDRIYRVYPPSLGGVGLDVTCDMTHEGGGWTLCGNIDEPVAGDNLLCVEEGEDYLEVGDLQNASFCALYFEEFAPDGLMVHNRTVDSAKAPAGTNERVFVDWSASPITLYDYDVETPVECYSTNANGTVRNMYNECAYVSHANESGASWQEAAWSFANGLSNEYTNNITSRVLLGPTYSVCDNQDWRNFDGRSETVLFVGYWGENNNIGDLYLR